MKCDRSETEVNWRGEVGDSSAFPVSEEVMTLIANLLPAPRPAAYDYDTHASTQAVDVKIQISKVCSGCPWCHLVTSWGSH